MNQKAFVNFSVEAFDSPWLGHQPLMAEVAKERPVLYVLPEINADRLPKNPFKWRRARLQKMRENVYQYTPSDFFPKFYFSRLANRLSTFFRCLFIKQTVNKLGWGNYHVVFWNPRFQEEMDFFPKSKKIFFCHDYFPAFAPEGSEDQLRIKKNFSSALNKADVIFAVSEAIISETNQFFPGKIHLLENGLNENFLNGVGEIPSELARVNRPLVGYIGRINRKVNFEILRDIALQKPNWTVLLMGPITGLSDKKKEEMNSFLKLPNALFLDGKPYNDLPRYFSALDVGLMVYHTDGLWTKFGHPLKSLEFMGVGKPSVCSDLPAVRKYAPHVQVAKTSSEWIQKIETALAADQETFREERRKIAARNTWTFRKKDFLSVIEGEIKE